MSTYTIIAVGLTALLLAFLVWQNFRFLQTIYLITQTTPYTQEGTGDGTILIIGDSTGYGTGAGDPALSIAGRIGADFPTYTIENRSQNGDTIAAANERTQNIAGQYELIVLQLGGNDVLQAHKPITIEADITALYTRLQRHTDQIVMLSLGNIGAAPAFSGERAEDFTRRSLTFHGLLGDFASSRPDFTYVSLYEDPTTDPFVKDPSTHMSTDGLHPTATGYAVWYKKLLPVLEETLSADEHATSP